MAEQPAQSSRPATVDDLKSLLRSLTEQGADYLLIRGYALYALGYQRGTVDIDIVEREILERALLESRRSE